MVLPLFPQYSSAATGSAVERVYEVLGQQWNVPPVETVGAFYDDPGFIAAFTRWPGTTSMPFRPDFVLFSYHGLPERHVRKSDASGRHCLQTPHLLRRHRPREPLLLPGPLFRHHPGAGRRAWAWRPTATASRSSRAWAARPG